MSDGWRAWLLAGALAFVVVGAGCADDDISGGDCLDLAGGKVKVVSCDDAEADVKVGCGESQSREDERFITIGGNDTRCVTNLP